MSSALLRPARPPAIMFVLASMIAFSFSCACYRVMAPHFEEVKQISWIITFLGSSAMSQASLPFLWDFVSSGGDMVAVRHRAQFARAVCGAFQGFLLADLATGAIHYPEQLSLLIGWAHHIGYALLMPYITSRGWAHVFCVCLAMEIPTCMLASSFLWPNLRNDLLYNAVFFSSRIALHAKLLTDMLLPRGRYGAVGGSFIPACLFGLTFVVHSSWFVSSVKGIIRRSDRNKSGRVEIIEHKVKVPEPSQKVVDGKMSQFGIPKLDNPSLRLYARNASFS